MKSTHYYIIAIITAILSLFACPLTAEAQTRKVMNRPYIDQRLFHYGFLAGVHLQDIELEQHGYTDEEGNQWVADIPNYDPGFTVGILGALRLTEHLELRAIPSMHFGTKMMRFYNMRQDVENEEKRQSEELKSTYISLPVDLKFSAQRFNNYRPYMMVGINPMLDLTVKKNQNVRLNSFDCYIEAGLGCDFYAQWFKFIPEIKFCYGLNNIISTNRTDITDASKDIFAHTFRKGRSKMIVLTFYFE